MKFYSMENAGKELGVTRRTVDRVSLASGIRPKVYGFRRHYKFTEAELERLRTYMKDRKT